MLMPTPDDADELDTTLEEWDSTDLSFLEDALRQVPRRGAAVETGVGVLVEYLCGALSVEQMYLLERRLARDPASRARLRTVGTLLDQFQHHPLATLLTRLGDHGDEADVLRAFLKTLPSRVSQDVQTRLIARLRAQGAQQLREEARAHDGEARALWRWFQSALPGLVFPPSASLSSGGLIAQARGVVSESGEANDEPLPEWFEKRLQDGHILTFQGETERAPAYVRAVSIPRVGPDDTLLLDLAVPETLRRVSLGKVLRLGLVVPPFSVPEDAEASPMFTLFLGEWSLDTWDSDAPRTVRLVWTDKLAVPSVAFLRAWILVPDTALTS